MARFRIIRPTPDEVAEDRFGLIAAAHIIQDVAHLVRRCRLEGTGGGIITDYLLARDRP